MSRALAIRPMLLPALRRFWRDPHRLQLGTAPGRAVILELTDPAAARLLDLLDGTRTRAGLIRAAVARDIDGESADRIISVLSEAGLVVDAEAVRPRDVSEATRRRLDAEVCALALGRRSGATPAAVLRRRLAAQVLITGSSRLAVPVATVLASSGIGHIDPDLSGVTRITDAVPGGLAPEDARRPRGVAAADAVRRAAPDIDLSSLRQGRATFAVLVGAGGPAELTALSYDTRRLAHLAVTIRDGIVVVGPLVRPGRSPCLNCIDLHRRDRDPGWPAIAAQLQTTTDPLEPAAATTVLAAAAYAAAEVLDHIDGEVPRTVGATVEISRAGEWTRRQWPLHPACDCQRRRRVR